MVLGQHRHRVEFLALRGAWRHWCLRARGGQAEATEVELADALQSLAATRAVFGCELEGRRFDCGSKLGYLSATLHFGMRHPAVGESFAAMVRAAADERPVAPGRERSTGLQAVRAANR